MLDISAKRRAEEGFTLIELMVVVMIIAILIAIAIPTFIGAQNRARDRAAQSDLRNGITAAKTIATGTAGLLGDVTVATMTASEGSLSFANGDGSTTAIGLVGGGSTSSPSPDHVLLNKRSESGTWYGVVARSNGALQFCKGDGVVSVNIPANCTLPSW